MRTNKLLLRWLAVFGLMIVFAVSGWGTNTYYKQERLFTTAHEASGLSSFNITGDFNITGTTVQCAVNASNVCITNPASTFTVKTKFVNDVPSLSTLNSASATLQIPTGATIKWAGLFWQGHIHGLKNTIGNPTNANQIPNAVKNAGTNYDIVKFKTPDGVTHTVDVDHTDVNSMSFFALEDNDEYRLFYQGYKDVTSWVKTSYSSTQKTFTVGDIQSTAGDVRVMKDPIDNWSSETWSIGNHGNWSLVVVFEDPSYPLRNVSVYDGFKIMKVITSGDYTTPISVPIHISGFLTPSGGTVNSKLMFYAGGGNKSASRDYFEIRNANNGLMEKLTNAVNPSDNVFNDTFSYFGTTVGSTYYHLTDIDTFNVSSKMAHNQTQTDINLYVQYNNGADIAFLGLLAFSTDIYQPFITIDKSTDSSGTVTPNQTITYTANIQNTGNEGASNIVIYDNFDDNNLTRIDDTPTDPVVTLGDLLDRNTTFVTNSLTCHYGPLNTDCKTLCSVTATPFKVACTIPTLAVGQTAYMQFQTKMASNPDTGGQSVKVENQMHASYDNALTGAAVDQSSSNIADAGQYIPAAASTFDAWETTLTKDTAKLYTKVVSDNFTFNVGTADGSTFNGAVCASVIDATGTVLSGGGYQCQDFTSASSFFSWTVTEAEKVAKIQIKSKSGTSAGSINLASPNWSGFADSNSTDSFAVRPDHFVLSAPAALMQAGENYGMSVNAYDSAGGNAQGYDQDFTNLTASPATWWQRDSAAVLSTVNTQGTVTLGSGTFTNGIGAVPISFNDVGKFTLRVNDNNWAAVDGSDGTASDVTTIQGEEVMTFIPYRFNISAGTVVNNDGNTPSFTYLSSDLNMSARIPITVSAQNKQGATTQNYANNMYERMITITPSIASTDATTRGLIPITSGAINADADFTAGTKSIVYNDSLVAKFNFSRNPNVVVSPFDVYSSHGVGNDVNVSIRDADGVYGDKNQTLGGFATFVYGRLIPRDVRVFGSVPFTANAWYEVYNAPSINGTALAPSKNESMWYINRLHNDTTGGDGNITMISPVIPNTATPISSVSNGTGIETYNFNGIGNANIPYNGKAHINTDPWLWYGVNAAAYSDPAVGNTNCLTHPCFNITVSPDIGASGSAKEGASSNKANKSTTNTGNWHSTSDYAPAVR